MFYCLVVGSRGITDYPMICRELDRLLASHAPNICIVSGGARGVDSLAEKYAHERNYETRIFPAKWDVYGKSAGYRRNEEMHRFLSQKEERLIVAFWDGASKGTAHNFTLAPRYNNPIITIRP